MYMEIMTSMTDDEWKQEFIELSNILSKKFSNLSKYIDVFSESYLFLLEYYVTKGLMLPDKNNIDNIKCFYISAKRHIIKKFKQLKIKQKYETMTEFDEELDLDVIDKETEHFLDDLINQETDLPIKIDRLLNSEHKENQQLGMFAKCLIDSEAAGLQRYEAIELTKKIMKIGTSRFYELQNQLASFLEYRSDKYKRKL